MAFEVTITEIRTVKRVVPREWQLGAGSSPGQYGYAPEIEKTITERVKRLEQTVDTLDLPKVIAAVNGLEYDNSAHIRRRVNDLIGGGEQAK